MKNDIDAILDRYNAQGNSEIITIPDYLFKEERPAWSKYCLQRSMESNQQGPQTNNLVICYEEKDKSNPIFLTLNIPVIINQTIAGAWMERNLEKTDKLLIGESKKGDFKNLFIADRLAIGGNIIEQSQVVRCQPITSYKVYELGSNSKQSYHVLKTLGGLDEVFKVLSKTNKT